MASDHPNPGCPRAVSRHQAPVLAGAPGSSSQTPPRTSGDYPFPPSPTPGGQLTLGRPVRKSVGGMQADRREVLRSRDGVTRPGGRGNPHFSINDFTVVSHTETSFLFTSSHPFFPGWVRVVSAHNRDQVRKLPCPNNPDEEEEARKRIRLDVEPGEGFCARSY